MKIIIPTLSLLVVSYLFSSCKKEEVIVEDYIVPILYYRLEMVDMDSTTKYSSIEKTRTPMTLTQSRIQGLEIPTSDGDDDGDDDYEPKNFCEKYPKSIKCRALPVLLEYFKIDKIGSNYVTLKWKSLDETNFKVYNIQRSRDAKTYKKIGEIKPIGAMTEYTYVDRLNK
jgi:hypothetical protein